MIEPLRPPRPQSPSGDPRRVGVELEYTGPDCAMAASLVAELFGGSVAQLDAHRCDVRATQLGDFRVELDMTAAHPGKSGEARAAFPDRLDEALRAAVGTVGSLVMPYEIVAPPVAFDRLGAIDRLVAKLREVGARGTQRHPLHAFGLHLNPELPALDAEAIVDTMKAFAVLAPWLRSVIGVDLTRRLAPYIQPWPEPYVRKLVDPDYRPALDRLIDDYIAANPSRNRELDLYPLFAYIDRDRVLAQNADKHVKPRPTWHYRMPDSRVDQPRWGVTVDWNRWVMVERLAADRGRLERMGADLAPKLAAK